MKFGVVIFPGSNCDEDMLHVLGNTYGKTVTKLWHKDRDLQGCDFIVLPGGFSYGDYLRSGALARYSPIMQEVIDFAANGGFVMGVCNGFQILCESGLLPGALLRNENRLFQCENVYIKAEHANSRFTAHVPAGKALKIPIAHGEGRYHADAETLATMNQNGQILYRYCTQNGEVIPDANPNGSLENIAGVCNAGGNVFGMMPHPERAASEDLSNTDGRYIFDSLVHLGVIMVM